MSKLEQEKIIYQKFKDAIWVIDKVMNNSACQEDFGENERKSLIFTRNYLSDLIAPQKERLEDHE